MNLYINAMNLIKSLNNNQVVTILFNNSFLNEFGIYETVTTEYKAEAQVQPIKKTIEDLTTTATRAVTAYDLWLVNLTPELINAFKDVTIQNTKILLDDLNILLSIIEKENHSYNGWIYLKGVENEKHIEHNQDNK